MNNQKFMQLQNQILGIAGVGFFFIGMTLFTLMFRFGGEFICKNAGASNYVTGFFIVAGVVCSFIAYCLDDADNYWLIAEIKSGALIGYLFFYSYILFCPFGFIIPIQSEITSPITGLSVFANIAIMILWISLTVGEYYFDSTEKCSVKNAFKKKGNV